MSKDEATPLPAPTFGSPRRHRAMSSIEDFTVLEIDYAAAADPNQDHVFKEVEASEGAKIPKATLVIVAETEVLHDEAAEVSTGLLASMNEMEITQSKSRVRDWDCKKMYTDLVKEGLDYNNSDISVVMLYESPSSKHSEETFHNKDKFKFHDWPPPKYNQSKVILGPCRYSLMNGSTFPAFLRKGATPPGLQEHWAEAVPDFVPPIFVDKITDDQTIYAYLPVEQIKNHVNDPAVHYHLAGKDAIHLMTQKTTKLLPDTRTSRPCVVKTTHSMGSKGIFIINDDKDEEEFHQFLKDSGNPTFVVTDFVDIRRNVACHFFMHPNGDVIWFGSNENKRLPDGHFSSDSYLLMDDQEHLKDIQLPFILEVVQYCKNLGFWGFCGCDVLFDSKDRGYLVDINPRVTGSCPALMTLNKLSKKYGFKCGLFRRSGDTNYFGSAVQLLEEVSTYNKEHEGESRVVIHSMYEPEENRTRVNIGVYGNDMDECKTVLNHFAKPSALQE